MLCQKCNKKQAMVYYNKVLNGKKTEIYLCEDCMKEYPELSFEFDIPLSINSILSSLGYETNEILKNEKICPKCNSTRSEIKESGKFGCSKCYEIFKNDVNSIIEKVHGCTEHIGKAPRRSFYYINIKSEISKLKGELNLAVINEEFEEAAILRDKVRELEKNINQLEGDGDE